MKNAKRWMAAFLALCLLSLTCAALADTLKKGSKGDEVQQIQTWLIDLGYLNDVADGAFGKKTEAAVKAFQKTIGAKQDGKLTDDQQTQLLLLWGDVTGIMEGDGLSPEELREMYPDGCCRTGDNPGEADYCWRHQESGYLIQLLTLPGLPDKAVQTLADRAVNLWTAQVYDLYNEWAKTNPTVAKEQRESFEDAMAEVVPDLNDYYGTGSAAARRELAFWLEGVCVDRCFDLHTAEGNGY